MKSNLLLLTTAIGATAFANTQQPQLIRKTLSDEITATTIATRAETESSMDEVDPKVLSYLSPDPFYPKSIAQIPAQNNKVSVMTRYSGDLLARFKGNHATRLSMAVAEEAISVRVFILDDNGNVTFEKTISDLKDIPGSDVWGVGYLWGHEVNVDVDFDLTDAPFILGYEVEIAPTGFVASIPVIIQSVPTKNVCFVDQHIGYGIQPYYGAPYMMIHTEGEGGLVDYDACLLNIAPARVATEQNFNEAGEFINLGTRPISEIQFDYTNPNGSKQSYTLASDEPLGYMSTITFAVPMVGNNVSSSVDCPVSISRLNGNADNYPADNTLSANIISMDASDAPERTVVVEIATGTWCGYCPKALTAIEYLPEYTKAKHIPIEIHVTDIYEGKNIDNYKPYVNAAPGIPYAWVNRSIACDPWTGLGSDPLAFGFGDLVDFIGNSLVELSVDVDGIYDAENGTITLNATTIPAIDLNQAERYKVAFALLENGLMGLQTNYYSHDAANPYPKEYLPEPMLSWWDADPTVLYEYSYTLRSISDANGSETLGKGLVNADSAIRSSYTFEASDVDDYSKSIAVAFIFDTLSGEIVNAAQAPVTAGSAVHTADASQPAYTLADGILSLDNVYDIAVYDVSGRKVMSVAASSIDLTSLSAGAYIINASSARNSFSIKVRL